MHLAVRRLALPLLASALAAACGSLEVPAPIAIPAGSAIYKLAPTLLTEEFTDSTAGQHFTFTWLSGEPYFGTNCLGFLPTTPTDTTGTFVFTWAGQNTGRVERRSNGVVTDTATAYFFAQQAPGTHGTFVVNSAGQLTLNWADGVQSWYFAPSAVLRLVADTLESRADLRAQGDSIRALWHVVWTSSATCP